MNREMEEVEMMRRETEEAEKASKQVPSQVVEISERLAILGKNITYLSDQLAPVLRGDGSQPQEKQIGAVPSDLVPLATDLLKQRNAINKLIRRVDNIANRVEL